MWAIGVNLYLAIAKWLPFDGETADEYVNNLLDSNSQMAEIPDSTPDFWKEYLPKMLAKDQNERISPEELYKAMGGTPVTDPMTDEEME